VPPPYGDEHASARGTYRCGSAWLNGSGREGTEAMEGCEAGEDELDAACCCWWLCMYVCVRVCVCACARARALMVQPWPREAKKEVREKHGT